MTWALTKPFTATSSAGRPATVSSFTLTSKAAPASRPSTDST